MSEHGRHIRALLRKNATIKCRTCVATLIEILVPVSIAVLLAAVKSVIKPDYIPTTANVAYGNDIVRVGDLRETALLLEVQEKKLAVIAETPDLQPTVDRFIIDMSTRYPPLDGSTFGGGGFVNPRVRDVRMPGFQNVYTTAYKSEKELDSWLRSKEYPGNIPFSTDPTARGRVWAAVVFKAGAPHWDYTLRFNASEIPSTRPPYVDTLFQGFAFNIFKYASATPVVSGDTPFSDTSYGDGSSPERRSIPGFLALQLAIDRWILDLPLPMDALSQNDITSKVGNAFWQKMGPDSNLMWQEFWSPDSNHSLMMQSALEYGSADLYAPHEALFSKFPIGAYTSQPFYAGSQFSAPAIFVIAFLVPISSLIRGIVGEKESRLKESMRMMGLSDVSLLLSWLITAEVQLLVTALILAGVLTWSDTPQAMFPGAGFGPVFALFALFGTASVAYAAFVSVFFSSSRAASTLGSMAYFAAFVPFYATGTTESTAGRDGKVATCILPPACFSMSFSHLMALEGANTKLILTGPGANGHVQLRSFAFTDGLYMLAASVVWFGLLTWYADAILPYPLRQYGTPKKWYFPCAWAWRRVGGRETPAAPPAAAFMTRPPTQAYSSVSGAVEKPDAYLQAKDDAGLSVQLHGIVKTFTGPDRVLQRAVDGLDLTLYEGQITVLLGHNGAGKTTLINVVTGLMPADAGSAVIFGRTIGTDFAAMRDDMGVCPQHDVLWPQLTCMEHLSLFASIKGIQLSETALHEALDTVGLGGKASALSSALSGGQKRKLSLAIALLGGPRFILLDEPTSGMDPYSRRATWEMLRKAREGRVILLTTHFMDEADVLGDRIAIMGKGALHSCGTGMFLKAAFGVGYNLSIVLQSDGPQGGNIVSQSDPRLLALCATVHAHVPDGRLSSSVAREVHFQLPLHASPSFPALLAALEVLQSHAGRPSVVGGPDPLTDDRSPNGLGVDFYGLGVTTMEDVFLAVAGKGHAAVVTAGATPAASGPTVQSDASAGAIEDLAVGGKGQTVAYSPLELDMADTRHRLSAAAVLPVGNSRFGNQPPPDLTNIAPSGVTGRAGVARQVKALLLKRVLFARRDLRGACLQLFLPLVVVVAGFAALQLGKLLSGDMPRLLMRPHFNADPQQPDGAASLYPNRVPSFAFKATGLATTAVSPELNAILRVMDVGDKTSFYSEEGRLRYGPELAKSIPDPYGLVSERSDGPYNDGWPSTGFAWMSRLLIARAETVLRKGLAYEAVKGTPMETALVGERDGGSVYGAVMFTLNGSAYSQQNTTASAFDAMLHPVTRGAITIDMIQNEPPPAPTLTYGVLLNTSSAHAAPIFANLVHSALYRLKLGIQAVGTNLDSAVDAATLRGGDIGSISISSHPMPFTVKEESTTSALFSFGAAAIVTIGFAFVPAANAAFVARERECGAKQQQTLSGLSTVAYWVSNYLFDLGVYSVPGCASILAAWAFNMKEFMGGDSDRQAAFVALVLLYGVAVAPFAYLLSFLFKTSMGAQSTVLALSVASVVLIIASMVMSGLPETCIAEGKARFALMLLPGYSLGNGLVQLAFLKSLPVIKAVCAVKQDPTADFAALARKDFSALDMQVVGWNLVFLAAEAIVYGCLTLIADAYSSGTGWFAVGGPTASQGIVCDSQTVLDEDEDVGAERMAVEAQSSIADKHGYPPILLQRLRKVYNGAQKAVVPLVGAGGGAVNAKAHACFQRTLRKPIPAVVNLSFSVPAGQVFGFLGVNGAGKTTTMEMLTGAIVPSNGRAWLGGYDIATQRQQLRRLLGYCPQHDPLLELLTVREHIELYARLRGVPEPEVHACVTDCMGKLELQSFAGKLSGSLSGGNKRKLCVAVALVGSPRILFLDEPTTGMDPVAKRIVWQAVRAAASPLTDSTSSTGASIVLTTHSMEEAEALASRIGIMVAGSLRCLGSASHLKGKLGEGFQLQLQLATTSEEAVSALEESVRQACGRSITAATSAVELELDAAETRRACGALLSFDLTGILPVPLPLHMDGWAALKEGKSTRLAMGMAVTQAKTGVDSENRLIGSTQQQKLQRQPSSGILARAAAGIRSGAGVTVHALAVWIAQERRVQACERFFIDGFAAPWLDPTAVNRAEAASSGSIFHGGYVLEVHGLSMRLHIPRNAVHSADAGASGARDSVPLSAIFAGVEAWKDALGIATSALSEATLEQVFNTFAGADDLKAHGQGKVVNDARAANGSAGDRSVTRVKPFAGLAEPNVSKTGPLSGSAQLHVRVPIGRASPRRQPKLLDAEYRYF